MTFGRQQFCSFYLLKFFCSDKSIDRCLCRHWFECFAFGGMKKTTSINRCLKIDLNVAQSKLIKFLINFHLSHSHPQLTQSFPIICWWCFTDIVFNLKMTRQKKPASSYNLHNKSPSMNGAKWKLNMKLKYSCGIANRSFLEILIGPKINWEATDFDGKLIKILWSLQLHLERQCHCPAGKKLLNTYFHPPKSESFSWQTEEEPWPQPRNEALKLIKRFKGPMWSSTIKTWCIMMIPKTGTMAHKNQLFPALRLF